MVSFLFRKRPDGIDEREGPGEIGKTDRSCECDDPRPSVQASSCDSSASASVALSFGIAPRQGVQLFEARTDMR